MTTIYQVKKNYFKHLVKIQDAGTSSSFAFLGDKDGTVKADNLGNVYILDFNGNKSVVYNSTVPHIPHRAVEIGWRNKKSKILEVLRFIDAYPENRPAEIPDHWENHQWPNYDTLFSRKEQLLTGVGTVFPVSGETKINALGGVYTLSNVPYLFNDTVIDLSSEIPTSDANWVLIEIDNTGAVTLTPGSSVANRNLLTYAEIPAFASGLYPICAVKVYEGQLEFIRNKTDTDIIDFRFTGLGSGGGIPAGSDGEMQYNDAGAFGADPLFWWDDAEKHLWVGGHPFSTFLGRGFGVVAGTTANLVARGRFFHFAAQSSGAGITTGGANGTADAPEAVTDGKVLGQWSIVAWYDSSLTAVRTIGTIRAIATDDHSSSSQPFKWEVSICKPGENTPTLAVTIHDNGSMELEAGAQYLVNGAQHTHDGENVNIDASGFSGNLDGSVTDVQLLADAVDALTVGGGSSDGWTAYNTVIPTRTASADPTYTIQFAGVDLTAVLYEGMPVKWTQNSIVRYGWISSAPVFSTDTTVTVLTRTDSSSANYDILDTGTYAISNFAYGLPKQPGVGFPAYPEMWDIIVQVTTAYRKDSPATNTWYQAMTVGGNLPSINLPLGRWGVEWSMLMYGEFTSGTRAYCAGTLSTTTNSETDKDLSNFVSFQQVGTGNVYIYSAASRNKNLVITTATTYNFLLRTVLVSQTYIGVDNVVNNLIKAKCNYL